MPSIGSVSSTFGGTSAPKHVSTSVEAQFSAKDAVPNTNTATTSTPAFVMEESSRPPIIPPANTVDATLGKYFRVHPSAILLKLVTTSGSVSQNTINLFKSAEEVLSFGGNDVAAPLRYPAALNVTFTIIGNLIPVDGQQLSITLTFDSTRNALVASRLCYGNVRVRYQAPYDLWLAKFDTSYVPLKPTGLPKTNTTSPDDDPQDNSRPMTILAYWKAPSGDQDPNQVLASLNLSPPDVNTTDTTDQKTPASNVGTGSQLPTIRFEIDPQYPSRLLPVTADGVIRAGARVRVIPQVQPDLTISAGQATSWIDGTGEIVDEQLAYSNTETQTLRYQPVGSVNFNIVSVFVTKWGRAFTPTVFLPGSTVTVVNWISEGTFSNPSQKIVNQNEIIIGDEFGNAVPCFGVLSVSYTYTYKAFDFVFNRDSSGLFQSAFITGVYIDGFGQAEIANIKLDPPQGRGIG